MEMSSLIHLLQGCSLHWKVVEDNMSVFLLSVMLPLLCIVATDRQNFSNKAGKYNDNKDVTVFEFMNNMRTTSASEAEKQVASEVKQQQVRKREVQKNLHFDSKRMNSVF
jgi:hypothetical protein